MDNITDLVSVIMPAYNAEKYIEMSIASVIHQTYENVELVIVDDGSTDSTVEIIDRCRIEAPDKIKVFVREKNGGTAAALNDAIGLAEGKYICWLSADDLYAEDMVESEVKYLKDHGEYDAVFSRCAFIDESNQFLGEQTYENGGVKKIIEQGMPGIVSRLLVYNLWHGCSLLAKARCFKESEKFNLDYKCSQDYDFWLRLAADYDIGFLDQVNVFSREHSEQGSKRMNCNLDEIVVFFNILKREEVIRKLMHKMNVSYTLENIKPYILSRVQGYQGREDEMATLNKELKNYLNMVEERRICFD